MLIAPIGFALQNVRVIFDGEGVFALKIAAHGLDGRSHGLFVHFRRAFANAGDALIGDAARIIGNVMATERRKIDAAGRKLKSNDRNEESLHLVLRSRARPQGPQDDV